MRECYGKTRLDCYCDDKTGCLQVQAGNPFYLLPKMRIVNGRGVKEGVKRVDGDIRDVDPTYPLYRSLCDCLSRLNQFQKPITRNGIFLFMNIPCFSFKALTTSEAIIKVAPDFGEREIPIQLPTLESLLDAIMNSILGV